MVKVLVKVCLALGLFALFVSLGLYHEHHGYRLGILVSEEYREVSVSDAITFSQHGTDAYEYLTEKYKFLGLLFIFYLIGKFFQQKASDSFFERRLIFHGICFFALSMALYQLWWLFAEKGLRAQSLFWNEPHDSLMRSAVLFDWFLLVNALLLMIIEILLTALCYYRRQQVS